MLRSLGIDPQLMLLKIFNRFTLVSFAYVMIQMIILVADDFSRIPLEKTFQLLLGLPVYMTNDESE
jgi:hypothetical protein